MHDKPMLAQYCIDGSKIYSTQPFKKKFLPKQDDAPINMATA